MLRRIDVVGNPNIGVFIQVTDDVAIVLFKDGEHIFLDASTTAVFIAKNIL